ncbi:hypothetical protein B0O99DRAFT_696122 [Bisporella sp. PMI_857]|nr:hypothetical protein B0O99DRAFT_696122 [Bisporella sp. PMI_857]
MGYVDTAGALAAPSIPSRQNPFILGYVIVQKPASVQVSSHPTPPSFIPRSFQLSVVPPNGNIPSLLNYLVTTHRDPDESEDRGNWSVKEDFESDQKIKGYREVVATMSGDPAQQNQVNGTHRLFLTFNTALCYHFDSAYRGSNMNRLEDGDVFLKFRIVLVVDTSEDGRWVFTLGDSVLPEINDGQQFNVGLGVNMPNLNWSGAISHLPDFQTFTNASIQTLMFTLNKAMPTLNDTILMPAGDMYTFNGLDATDEGHVLARIKYGTRTFGERV